MILIDSSVWIEQARGRADHLPQLLGRTELVTCMPIVFEVIRGAVDERVYRTAYSAMVALRILDDPMPREVFLDAVSIYRAGRRQGFTIRSSMDCLIAAVAIRHGIPLLHKDRDFDAIAQFTPLDARAFS